MPTVYTEAVQNGEITTLAEFGRRCACAFIYDTSSLPRQVTVSTYHKEKIAEAKAELAKRSKYTPAQWARAARREYLTDKQYYDTAVNEKKVKRERHLDMTRQVENWQPHELLVGLRTFMLQQLKSDLDHDFDERYNYYVEPIEHTGEAFKEYKLNQWEQEINYHSQELQVEISRVEDNNLWLDVVWTKLPK